MSGALSSCAHPQSAVDELEVDVNSYLRMRYEEGRQAAERMEANGKAVAAQEAAAQGGGRWPFARGGRCDFHVMPLIL